MALWRTLCALAAAPVFAACASSTVVAPPMTDARSAITAAEALGAADHPRAAAHLKWAKDQYRAAQAQMADDEAEEAMLLYQRAEADAELALVLARAAQAQSVASDAEARVEAVRGTD